MARKHYTITRGQCQHQPLGHFDTKGGAPIFPSDVQYRGKKPVTVHFVISRLGDSVWYLGPSSCNPNEAVARYK
jgi:hypothetical protein